MPDTHLQPICLWSGPRNVSTALMYSFAQLEAVRVVDEPLYGHYLTVSGADHPGRDDVIAAMNCDGDEVMRVLLERQRQDPSRRLFLKHMAHHLVGLDTSFLELTTNVLLVRDPREMLPSLTIQLPDAGLDDTGLRRQWQLFEGLRDAGTVPVVVDARELLLDPAGVLRALCHEVGIPYSHGMLSWPAGPRKEDGVWAPHWYDAVHKSRGFQPYRPKSGFPAHLQALLDECEPWYRRLYDHALRARPDGDHSEPTRSS